MAESLIAKTNGSNIYDLLGVKRYSPLFEVWGAYINRISELKPFIKSGEMNAAAEASLLQYGLAEIADPLVKKWRDIGLAVSDPSIELSVEEKCSGPKGKSALVYFRHLAVFERYNMNQPWNPGAAEADKPYTGKMNGTLFIEEDGFSLLMNRSEQD